MTEQPAEPIHYRVAIADPHAHLFRVSMTIREPDPDGQLLMLPAWIPGSYLIREFARHVVAIAARRGSAPVRLRKLDKHSWRADPGSGALTVQYDVYGWDLSVRAAHLDATHAFFNGTSMFLRALGREHEPHSVDLAPPRGAAYRDWRVATTLQSAGAPPHGFGRYRARDYDELVDHPVEMGRFALGSFVAGGAAHEIAVTGRTDVDLARLCRDLKPICDAHIALFEPRARRAPVDRYLFLATAVGDGYGGLEHRASTALLCARNELPYRGMRGVSLEYHRFLALASHEYFHTWLIKRIKPAAFVPYDLSRENYSSLLWIFEGFTSYYDDLMLLRAGVIDLPMYLKSLATTISAVLRGPGRLRQSVAESSFDAWIKYYRQDENTPNVVASYYAKGALVALALDLTIRLRTRARRSLDDVLRLMWREYGRDFYAPGALQRGVAEDEFPQLVRRATGLDLRRQIRDWAYGTRELPLPQLFDAIGIDFRLAPPDPAPALGARLATRHGELTVATAYDGQAARRAGLAAGDVIVAADGLRVDEKSLKALLTRRRAGERLALHVFRRDELMRLDVELQPPAKTEVTLALRPRAARARSPR